MAWVRVIRGLQVTLSVKDANFAKAIDSDCFHALSKLSSKFRVVEYAINTDGDSLIIVVGVLIDGTGYYSLIEISNSGDCAERTLVTVGTPREVYDHAKRFIAENESDEE